MGGSGDDVIGLGGSPSSTLIEHYNGTAWSIVPSPSPGTDNALTGVTESSATDLWAVGYDIPTGAAQAQTLTLNWNGTAWTTVASPDQGSPSLLTSVSTTPGDAIVWAARLQRHHRLLQPAPHAERLAPPHRPCDPSARSGGHKGCPRAPAHVPGPPAAGPELRR